MSMSIFQRLRARFQRLEAKRRLRRRWLGALTRKQIENSWAQGQRLRLALAPDDLRADPRYGDYLAMQLCAARAATEAERRDARARTQALVDRMLDYVPMSDRRAANVLAVGCRDGRELDALAEITGGHVRGLDLLNEEGDERIEVGDVHRLPHADDSLDIVVACHLLEHAHDVDLAASELLRVLRPGGWLILELELGFTPDAVRPHDAGSRDELSWFFQQRVDDPSRDQVLVVDHEIEQRIGERSARSQRLFLQLEPPPGGRVIGLEPPEAGEALHLAPPPGSLVVRLDITNKCNLECIHCSLDWTRRAFGEPKANMPVADFARIAEQIFPLAATVALSYEAEPMMHKDFLDILDIVRRFPGPGYVMTTNGTLIRGKRLDALFDCGLHHLNVSFDGATKSTFEHVRKKGRFERAVAGVLAFRDRKRELGLGRHDFPALQINYTLMRSTLEELPQMVELCREWDVHQLTLQHLYNMPVNKLYGESLIHHKKRSDEVLMRARKLCERYDIRTVFPRLFEAPPGLVQLGGGAAPRFVQAAQAIGQGAEQEPAPAAALPPRERRSFYCLAPWRMLKIRWNGEVLPCDVWRDRPLGNLSEQSFEQIWTSDRYRRLRNGLAHDMPSQSSCVHCDTVTTDNLEGKEVSSPFAHTPQSDLRGAPIS